MGEEKERKRRGRNFFFKKRQTQIKQESHERIIGKTNFKADTVFKDLEIACPAACSMMLLAEAAWDASCPAVAVTFSLSSPQWNVSKERGLFPGWN